MIVILVRTVACVLLFCVPIFVFMATSRQQHAGLIILVPLFGFIPALAGALLVFVPIEISLDRVGLRYLKNFLVPLAGACLPLLTLTVLDALSGSSGRALSELISGKGFSGWLLWTAFGAVWGVLWRASDWLGRYFGWFGNS